MDLPDTVANLELGSRRPPTTWVVHESTQKVYIKPKRRKGARGKATGAELAAMLEPGAKSVRNQQLREEQLAALRLKREPRDHSVACLGQEDEEGNVEYKLRIKDPHPVRLQQLITQMKFRLSEGNGECFYYIGVEDNGYPKGLDPPELDASIATLHTMAQGLGATVTLLQQLPGAWGRRAALLRVAVAAAQEAGHMDLRIVVAGSVDAGKSTLVAVLTHGTDGRPLLDNGRGLARINVFRHKHEMQSGRTSSICHQLLGYDAEGRVINYATPAATALTPSEVTTSASRVLTFLDMGGHERYLKTALYGMTALLPDYGLLVVCAVAGPGRVAVEHLAVAVALEVPVAVVITKVELVTPERFAAVVAEVRALVALTLQHEAGAAVPAGQQQDEGEGGEGPQRRGTADARADFARRVEEAAPLVTTEAAAVASAHVMCGMHADALAAPQARHTLRVHTPIFGVSAVTGAGLPVLHAFLNGLQPAGALRGAAAAAARAAAASCAGGPTPPVMAGPAAGGDTAQEAVQEGTEGVHEAAAADAVANGEQHVAEGVAVSASTPNEAAPVHFQVDGSFEVEGVGSVVSGTLLSGMVRLGQQLLLGPDAEGAFTPVTVRQLQRSHVPVQLVRAGQTCTIAISLGVQGPGAGQGGLVPVQPAAGLGQGMAWAWVEGGDAGALPLGSSPGMPCGEMLGAAGEGGMGSSCPGAEVSYAATMPAGCAGCGVAADSAFDDALAAAANALDLCLGGDDGLGGGGGAGLVDDDDLFTFDVCDGGSASGLSSSALSSARSPGAGAFGRSSQPNLLQRDAFEPPYGSAGSAMHLSMSVGQLGRGGAAAAASSLSGAAPASSASTAGEAAAAAATVSTSAPTHRSVSVSVSAATSGLPFTYGGPQSAPGLGPGGLGVGGVGMSGVPVSLFSPGPGPRSSLARKGCVLLEPSLEPRASWMFEAVLVLLGGHWPPRGLLSGSWPPRSAPTAGSVREGGAEGGSSDSHDGADAPSSRPDQDAGHPEATRGRRQQQQQQQEDELLSGASSRSAVTGESDDGCGGGGGTGLSSAQSGSTLDCGLVRDGDGGAGSDSGRREGGGGQAKKESPAEGLVRTASRQSMRRRQRAAAAGGADGGLGTYLTVVHCGSVRQTARVMEMRELLNDNEGGVRQGVEQQQQQEQQRAAPLSPDLRVSASTRAAAALLHSVHAAAPSSPRAAAAHAIAAAAGAPGVQQADLGCLVRVVLRWQHRPEWLVEGAKLVVRDRCDGRVAGAGFVRRVLPS